MGRRGWAIKEGFSIDEVQLSSITRAQLGEGASDVGRARRPSSCRRDGYLRRERPEGELSAAARALFSSPPRFPAFE